MKNERIHSTLLGVVGAYLVYLAYQLFERRAEADAAMPPAVRIVFIAFFALAGAAVMGYAFVLWRKSSRGNEKQEQHKDDDTPVK